ncbi:MAG TPA: L-seryl-tRNA(Sec) selenium transferase [Pyrinomonadaceae bacterium]|jgi:L-seryl-tRNA(Ser) seleniumtransferase|nr:L-seryl-tRNA(Sec) selenium transferase [Pyrinomonadaceae bacterium]
MNPKPGASFRSLPSVDELVRSDTGQAIAGEAGTRRLTELSRQVIAELRTKINDDGNIAPREKTDLLTDAELRLGQKWQRSVSVGTRRVINATGVVIHTNLGRAPLSESARKKLLEAAGYCNLEYDLETGLRGKRGQRVEMLLCELTGAEDALVVNNCAAAAFFVLTVFAGGHEVIISRGELVEIGGDFRVPDVLARSGATLCEVGTTNRTKLIDYEKAINEKTAMILRVHPSNYRIVGFTASPSLVELTMLAHERNILLYEDAGSGVVTDLTSIELKDEPLIKNSIAAGADIVTFSGDKLLGGPQAGIIAGRRELVERLRKDPLYRALRVDKLTNAALEATLDAHIRRTAQQEISVLKMLSMTNTEIEKRAKTIENQINNKSVEVELTRGNSAVGGGSAPLIHPETVLIALRHRELSTTELEAKLRQGTPPVIARIIEDRVVIDLRTVSENEEYELVEVLNGLH